jgi:hypothetical protein
MTERTCAVLSSYYESGDNQKPYPSVATAVYHHLGDPDEAGAIECLKRTVTDQTQVISLLVELLVRNKVITEEDVRDRVLTNLFANEHSGREVYRISPVEDTASNTVNQI